MINFEDTTHFTNLEPNSHDPSEEVSIKSFNFAFMAYEASREGTREVDLRGYLSWKA